MRTVIFTLWFALAVSTVWACEVQALFSPYDRVDEAIHAQLVQARLSIHCSLYGITSLRLATNLVEAKSRGLDSGAGLVRLQAAGGNLRHALLKQVGFVAAITPVPPWVH